MEIPLTNGGVAIVDEGDYETVAPYSWRATGAPPHVYALGYIEFDERSSGQQFMHRFLLGLDQFSGLVGHHKNHNGLDNRRENIEALTYSEHRRLHCRERAGEVTP